MHQDKYDSIQCVNNNIRYIFKCNFILKYLDRNTFSFLNGSIIEIRLLYHRRTLLPFFHKSIYCLITKVYIA